MLKIKNLHRLIWKTEILKWINLEIKKAEAIWIVWPNGCWKTSFLNSINWFNKINSWKIDFSWIDITNLSIEKRANLWIWRVFQSFWIFRNLTLFENLSLAYLNKLPFYYKLLPIRFLAKDIKNEINEILKELHLYTKKDKLAWELSGWQMRLLEIARLYLQDTKVYLLDEPTAWVSPKLKWTVVNMLKKIIEKWKIVIIVEHDFAWLWEFVDRLVVMDDWKIILDWKFEEIKNDKKLKELYFGS